MITLTAHLEGISAFRDHLLAAVGRLDAATKAATAAAGAVVELETKNQLRKTSHSKKTPTPASPGSPPSLISGALMRSVAAQGPVGGAGTYVETAGPSIIYGRIQELGGDAGRHHASHLPARPYMKPALEESKPKLEALFVEAWTAALMG